MIAHGVWHYCTMNFIPQYLTNSGENSVGAHAGADMVHVSKHGMCWIMWMRDVCRDDTGGVSGGYGSVEPRHGSGGAMTCGVTCTRMRGRMKADNNNTMSPNWVLPAVHRVLLDEIHCAVMSCSTNYCCPPRSNCKFHFNSMHPDMLAYLPSPISQNHLSTSARCSPCLCII